MFYKVNFYKNVTKQKSLSFTLYFFTMQAILQQMIVASPSVNLKSYSSKKEKSGHIKTRKRKSRDEIYVDPKEAEAASTAAKVLEEAFHQLCEMCGHYFQVGAKVLNPKYSKHRPYLLAYHRGLQRLGNAKKTPA